MKRFYREAASRVSDGRWAIELDGRPVRTPAGGTLAVPTPALAQAICDEWNAQGDRVDTQTMPLTRISNAAIDLVPSQREAVIGQMVQFGETDLLCYRAAEPEGLAARQQAKWQPPLDWLLRHYDAPLRVTTGIGHVAQPEQSLAVLRATLAGMNDFQLAAMSNLVTLLGSIVLALAIRDRAMQPDEAWDASIVDEMYQAELWGDDPEAAERRAARKAELDVAAAMLRMLERRDG
jgi:chaperone required for assembly of F1-ATPase